MATATSTRDRHGDEHCRCHIDEHGHADGYRNTDAHEHGSRELGEHDAFADGDCDERRRDNHTGGAREVSGGTGRRRSAGEPVALHGQLRLQRERGGLPGRL